jgi:hypothetical protein
VGAIDDFVIGYDADRSTMVADEILDYIFDGRPHLLADPMGAWLDSSRRFTAFVDTFRDKIRKKIRVTPDSESILDVRLELETAYLILREPRLSLVYEPQLSERVRAPDFAVSFTTSLTFMLEVTRLRARSNLEQLPGMEFRAERLMDAICGKLGQMQPKQGNVLLIGADFESFTQMELRDVLLQLQKRTEREDVSFLRRYGLRDRADFFRYYGRLSEVLVRRTDGESTWPLAVWVNPQAKNLLPPRVRTVLYRSQTL